MPHQTSLKSDQRDSPAAGVRSGVSGVLHDALTLAELQFKLLAVDAQAASGRAIVPVALLGSASVFAASALPLLLIALAQLLRDQAGWPPALATLASVGVGIVVAGVLALFGYFGLRTCLAPLGRSRERLVCSAQAPQRLIRVAAARWPTPRGDSVRVVTSLPLPDHRQHVARRFRMDHVDLASSLFLPLEPKAQLGRNV